MSHVTQSPIVVGIDGSAAADAALAWAVEEARVRGVALRLVHALDLSRYTTGDGFTTVVEAQRRLAEEILGGAVADLEDVDVVVESSLETGRPAAALLQHAKSAQMLVVGSRGHGDLSSMLLGSTSLQVAMHAPCPVTVLRADGGHRAWRSADHVLVGVDGTEVSEPAIELAIEEADLRGLGLVALHAWQWPNMSLDVPPPHEWDAAEDEARIVLSERMAGWQEKYPRLEVTRRVVRGDAAALLVAASSDAAVTVVGSRGAGGFKGLLLGSTSHAVLHGAHSPVAVVRTTASPR